MQEVTASGEEEEEEEEEEEKGEKKGGLWWCFFFRFLSSHLLAEAEAITVGGGRRTPNVSGRMLTMAGLFDIWRRKPNVSDCVHIDTSHQSHNINNVSCRSISWGLSSVVPRPSLIPVSDCLQSWPGNEASIREHATQRKPSVSSETILEDFVVALKP